MGISKAKNIPRGGSLRSVLPPWLSAGNWLQLLATTRLSRSLSELGGAYARTTSGSWGNFTAFARQSAGAGERKLWGFRQSQIPQWRKDLSWVLSKSCTQLKRICQPLEQLSEPCPAFREDKSPLRTSLWMLLPSQPRRQWWSPWLSEAKIILSNLSFAFLSAIGKVIARFETEQKK